MTEYPTSRDLATYMGTAVDDDRAEMLIGYGLALAKSYADPVPEAGYAVVMAAVARAYSNSTGASSETIGPYTVQRPPSGVFFTKAERVELRRISGGGGAFMIDPMPDDVYVDPFPFVPWFEHEFDDYDAWAGEF